ncbi:MAG TPA: SprT family zinc-dependent metalloprotease [Novosphingobium sp.]|nr:SprT family zinc-dependent metalloprotease [Novosphingobium sp.]
MLEWLRRPPGELPLVTVGARELPVVIRRLAQARRMTLRLAPDGGEVRVSIPRWGRTADAVAFAESRADWLAAQLTKIPESAEIVPGSILAYAGQPLTISHQPHAPRHPRIEGEAIVIGGPIEGLGKRLQRWLESKARAALAADLADYCSSAGQPVPRLALSRAQRRWGSCARDGTVRINWRLIMAPARVRRAVVAHEVAHLVHFDHSPQFHALLAQLFEDDIAAANRWLKHHGRSLYVQFG